MSANFEIGDYEQPKATYPSLPNPIDKRIFWRDPPYYEGEPQHQMTEIEFVQKLIASGCKYSYWYGISVNELAESLGII